MNKPVWSTVPYDANGNMTTDDQGHSYIYDAWNRLIEVNNGDIILASYSYDGLGRRITESAPGTNPTQVFFTPQDQVVEEDTGTSGATLHAQYVWSPVYVNALVLKDTNYTGDDSFTASSRVYALQDANFNVTGLVAYTSSQAGDTNDDGDTNFDDFLALSQHFGQRVTGGDAAGDVNHDGVVNSLDEAIIEGHFGASGGTVSWKVVERFVYDSYGQFTILANDFTTPITHEYLGWNYFFQGMRYDVNTGLYHADARDLKASLGRFIEQDPSGTPDGVNRYGFVDDNPTDRLDPSGFFAIHLAFDAFIPKSKGTPGFDGNDFNWGLEPGQFLPYLDNSRLANWAWFATDNRENPGDHGTSRIHTDATIDSTVVGAASKSDVTFSAHPDASIQLIANMSGGGPATHVGHTVNKAFSSVSGDYNVTSGCHSTTIHITADGSYPFGTVLGINVAPHIFIDVTWFLVSLNHGHSVFVSLTSNSKHTKYPAFEGIANDELYYGYVPIDPGPSTSNLGKGNEMALDPPRPIVLTH